jgi:class 3 adenylate cyclase
MAEPRIQYVTAADGVNLAFCTAGQGPPLVYMPTFAAFGHLGIDERITGGRHALEYLTARMQVIRYDRRGQGLSDRDPADDSLDAHVADLLTILDRLAIERVALQAPVYAGPVAITFAARHPERVSHLILVNTVASMPDAVAASPRVRAMFALLDEDWELFIDVGARMMAGWSDHEVATRVAAQAHAANTPEGLRRNQLLVRGWDASDLLPRVEAPTLVIESPSAFLSERSRRAAAAGIPGAQLRQFHLGGLTRDYLAQAVCEFVTGEAAALPANAESLPAGTAIILFTDIVDSTALTEQLGDAAFRARATRLDASMRSGISECGGTVVEGKVLGDGVMAVFTSARQAIDGAQRCLATADGTGLALHLGIHAGDVIREPDNVYGGAVNIASRICALSAPGELLVSGTVRDLARTSSGVAFDDRGEHMLKGIEDAVRVFAVRPGAG